MSKDKRVTTSSIFANAMATSRPHLGKGGAAKRVTVCPSCSAPRTDDKSLVCDRCGTTLVEPEGD